MDEVHFVVGDLNLESKDNQDAVIEMLAQNEEAIGRLYIAYSERFPSFKDLWLVLASEEKEHAAWIRKLGEQTRDGRVLFTPDRFRRAAIRSFQNYIEKEIVTAKGAGLQIINALSIAFYIEESLIERKYFEVFETDSVELKRLLRDLDAATRKHAQTIRAVWDQHRLDTGTH